MTISHSPRVVRCFFSQQFQPHLPAMELEWDPSTPGLAESTWFFPGNVIIQGPAPERFGVTVERLGQDHYSVRLLWNDVCMTWGDLRRVQIMTSSLAHVLQALGTDLWHVLDQPINSLPLAA